MLDDRDRPPPSALERFVAAQAGGVFEEAMREVRAGRKVSHWMWFVYPQLRGLGRSEVSRHYGIDTAVEARAYLAHPTLGPRIREAAEAALAAPQRLSAEDIFGPIDGEYASGHNPTKLAWNLTNTPVFQAFGNGLGGSLPAAVVELEIAQQNQEFHEALVAAGVKVDYQPQEGVHDWPYCRKHLQDAIK